MAFGGVAMVAILAVSLVALVREFASPPAVMVGALVLTILLGIVEPEEAFVGFSSPATITIAGLFVVARAISDHVPLDRATERLLARGSAGSSAALRRLLPPLTLLSGVTNNTPLVVTTAPAVRDWAERHGMPASHLLMPVSFAAILGGLITTIGTGPTLVVSAQLGGAGYEAFGFFTMAPIGLPLAVTGGALLILLAPRLLPDRRSAHQRVASAEREYVVWLRVVPGSAPAGLSVADAGLRDLESTYLAVVRRGTQEYAPVPPNFRLEDDDELQFVGRVEDVRDLLEYPGLLEVESPQTMRLDGDQTALFECIVGATSPLVGLTLKDIAFRGRYGGAVIAIHRSGARVQGKLGVVPLRVGDALLVQGDPDFPARWTGRSDFALVVQHTGAELSASSLPRWLTLGTFVAMIGFAASGLLSIIHSVLLACSVLVATRTIRFRRALSALDLEVLVIVACAIGLGAAMERSGLASFVGRQVNDLAAAGGPVLALAAILIGTMVLTEVVTNAAAAALMVPIAINAAERLALDPTGFAVAVAVGASASFLSPIGYQTNTIVYGLGGYRFGDYWRLGAPLAVLTIVASLVVIPRVFLGVR